MDQKNEDFDKNIAEKSGDHIYKTDNPEHATHRLSNGGKQAMNGLFEFEKTDIFGPFLLLFVVICLLPKQQSISHS